MSRPAERIDPETLTRFAASLLQAMGAPDARARRWAEILVWADLHGVDSHGVAALPHYQRRIEAGQLDPAAPVTEIRSRGAVRLLEAHRAPGHVAADLATERAIETAGQQGVGWVYVRNTSHTGAVGCFVDQIARAGMAGVFFAAVSLPAMAYPGTSEKALATNPIAIALPRAGHPPLLLDMASSTAAGARILRAREAGEPIPPGWGLDQNGEPTRQAGEVDRLTAMGGDKGALLSFMLEGLISLVVGAPLIAPVMAGGAVPYASHALAIALDPGVTGEGGRLAVLADQLASTMTELPAHGAPVRMPGDRRYGLAKLHKRCGLALSEPSRLHLCELARRLQVSIPSPLRQPPATGGARDPH